MRASGSVAGPPRALDVPHDVDLKKHLAQLHAKGDKPLKDDAHLCYWEITKVRLKDGGNHGKAWGKLVWRGKFSKVVYVQVGCDR